MPTYEYACRDCGRHFEVVQGFNDKPLTKCPTCKGTLKKVFSPVGIVLKGSGFYKTDSRGGKSAAASSAGKDSKDSKESKDSKDSKDSKAGSKSDSGSGSKSDSSGSSSSSSGSGSGSGGSDSKSS
jgi:putative FmdB family regulatory protein